jgi:hypothetical protein
MFVVFVVHCTRRQSYSRQLKGVARRSRAQLRRIHLHRWGAIKTCIEFRGTPSSGLRAAGTNIIIKNGRRRRIVPHGRAQRRSASQGNTIGKILKTRPEFISRDRLVRLLRYFSSMVPLAMRLLATFPRANVPALAALVSWLGIFATSQVVVETDRLIGVLGAAVVPDELLGKSYEILAIPIVLLRPAVFASFARILATCSFLSSFVSSMALSVLLLLVGELVGQIPDCILELPDPLRLRLYRGSS